MDKVITDRNLLIHPSLLNSILNGFAEVGDLQGASQLFQKFEDNDTMPTLITFNTLLNICNKSGQPRKAGEIMKILLNSDVEVSKNFSFHFYDTESL